MKTQKSRSKFEQCSGVCVGKGKFWFFKSNVMNAQLVQEKCMMNSQISLNLLKFSRSIQGRFRNTTIIKNFFLLFFS